MATRAARMLALMDRATACWQFPVLGPAKGRLVRHLLARHRPTRALEIGSLFGYSAILIASRLPPGGRLVCIEANPFLAHLVEANVRAAGLGRRVSVVVGDGRAAIPRLRGRFDFVLIDAAKEQYRDYLRVLEPKLARGAVVVADNTRIFRRAVAPYLDHVRRSPRYASREHDFGADAMEVSLVRGPQEPGPRRAGR